MRTIVKGKVLENKHYVNYYNPSRYYSYLTLYRLDKPKQEVYTNETVVDYETIGDFDFDGCLNVGDYIFTNDESCKIEKIEGNDENFIIYYVDTVVKTIENEQIKKELQAECDEYNKLQEEKRKKELQELFEREYKTTYEENIRQIPEINEEVTTIKKKWYQFWK